MITLSKSLAKRLLVTYSPIRTLAELLPSTVVDSLYRWQARFLAAWLRDIGMTVEVVEDSSHRPHLQPFRKLKF